MTNPPTPNPTTPNPRPTFRDRLDRAARPVPMLALALVASLLFATFLWLRGGNDDDSERRELLAVAQTYAENLTTYDSARLDADIARVLEVATGQFRRDYEISQGALRDLVVEGQGRSTGTVLGAAVVRLDDERGEVVLFVDQTVHRAATDDPEVDRLRMRMGLEKQSGRWLINQLDLV